VIAETSDTVDLVLAIVARLKHEPGPLLPILQAVQEAVGYLPADAVALIASELNLSRAEVYGVITFYHDFRQRPAGRHVLKLCRAEACQAMGGEALVARVEKQLGVACGHTSADGGMTLESVYCLGLCATAPSGMIDHRPVGRLTEAKLDRLLERAGV
jgi:formate dehydrogenase subunit gamma